MTIGDVADGVILSVTGLNPSDDTNVDKSYVMYLLAQVRDASVKGYLDKAVSSGLPIDSQYITREYCKVLGIEDEDCVDEEDERIYFNLTKRPLDIIGDRGVVEVTTDEKISVLKAQMQNITMFRDLRFSKPSPNNIVYYRHDKKIVIEGLSSKNISSDEFIVDYVPSLASENLAATDELMVSDALLPSVADTVTTMLMQQLGIPKDQDNDGVPPTVQGRPVAKSSAAQQQSE
jgi:hypothetical protein